jgi:uncharacterized damage-inducible protein DinB
MTTAELLLQDYDMEMAMTRRILERVPDDISEYKCHEKSMPLGKLTMHVATMPAFGTMILSTPGMDMASPPPGTKWPDQTFGTCEMRLATFDAGAGETRTKLTGMSDEELAAPWKFSFGEKVLSDGPKSLAFRHMFFNHMIHHRAQLGVYLRLNDLPVPGIYGPSADEPL